MDRADIADDLWRAEDGVAAIRGLFKTQFAIGPFFGTQIVADLVNIAPPGLAMTRDTLIPISGGSRYALRLVEGLLLPSLIERRAYDERGTEGRRGRQLRQIPEEVEAFARLVRDQPKTLSEPMTYIDMEHSLCEYARYTRLMAGDLTRAGYLQRDPS